MSRRREARARPNVSIFSVSMLPRLHGVMCPCVHASMRPCVRVRGLAYRREAGVLVVSQ